MRIGIVNDLPMAREALRRVVASSPEHKVAWLAADGAEAFAATVRDPADLILMDLVMPGVDGVEATRRIMAEHPCPILVVTASVTGNMGKVYEAMGLGALDAIDTPLLGPGGDLKGAEMLLSKIATVGRLTGKAAPKLSDSSLLPVVRVPAFSGTPMVAIGSSTGGPNALVEVLGKFPKEWPVATVLIQHVDKAFAPGLARWLHDRTGHAVEVAEAGARPRAGRIFLASTNDHLVLDSQARFVYTEEPRAQPFRPSVDEFFNSAVSHWRSGGVAVLLTGMGRDGAKGLLHLRKAAWHTIAEHESSCVVYGMPRAAAEIGAAAQVLPVGQIGDAVVEQIKTRTGNLEAFP